MGWLADLQRSLGEPLPTLPAPKPARPRQPKLEIKSVWITTRQPRDGDAGAVEAAHYSVADGVLTMRDEDGQATGKTYQLQSGDDPHMIAGRLARMGWNERTNEFNRPLNYRRSALA